MPDKEKDTRKILIEMEYGTDGGADIKNIQIKLHNNNN